MTTGEDEAPGRSGMTAWEEYVGAARRLDAVRREAAAVVANQVSAAQAAQRELAAVRHRLARQAARLGEVAARGGLPVPALPPVRSADAADPAGAIGLLGAARADLDAADRALSEVDSPDLGRGPLTGWSPAVRNTVVYGTFAFLVLVLQVVLFVVTGRSAWSVAALGCALVLPLCGYGLSWLAIGALFGGMGRVARTPVLGAAVSAVPVVLMCAGFGTYALMH